jgi:hypothetical protein
MHLKRRLRTVLMKKSLMQLTMLKFGQLFVHVAISHLLLFSTVLI